MLVIVIAASALAAGSGASMAQQPTSAVQGYVSAVQSRDASAVYAMLDPSMRMEMSEDDFEAWFDTNYDMVLEQARSLEARADNDHVEVQAEIPLDMGHLARLSWSGSDWRLDNQHLTRSDQKTPRETLTAFADALERGDFETILGLLSTERRSAYISEMEALRDRVSRADGGGIVTRGEEAILPLPNGDRIVFVRENGAWKIQSFEQADY